MKAPFIVVFLLLLMTEMVSAQTGLQNDSLKKDRKIMWGVFISPDYSYKIANNYNYDSYNISNNNINIADIGASNENGTGGADYRYNKGFEKANYGWNLGVKAFKRFSKRFAYSFGLLIDGQSYSTNTIDTVIGNSFYSRMLPTYDDTFLNRYQINFQSVFITFPISIEYLFFKKNRWSFNINLESSLHLLVYNDIIMYDIINGSSTSLSSIAKSGGSIGPSSNTFNLYSAISLNIMKTFNSFTLGFEPFFRYAVTANYTDNYRSSALSGTMTINGTTYLTYNLAQADIHFFQIGLSFVYYFANDK